MTTVLVHLNVEIPEDAFYTTESLAREIRGALEVGTDEQETPSLAVADVYVALAETL